MQEKFNPDEIKIIIGLGNPTEELRNTYHNVGLFAAEKLGGPVKGFKKIRNKPFEVFKKDGIYFAKSSSFMNVSGSAVTSLMEYLKIKNPEEVLVIHDDSDIPIGSYKLSFSGGSAGHKGVASVIKDLGKENFWRLRIGIREGAALSSTVRRVKAGEFVLNKISSKNKKILEGVFQNIKKEVFKEA